MTNEPTKFGEFLINYEKTKDELKQAKAKNDIHGVVPALETPGAN